MQETADFAIPNLFFNLGKFAQMSGFQAKLFLMQLTLLSYYANQSVGHKGAYATTTAMSRTTPCKK